MSYLTTTNLIKLIIDNKATKIELWATWNRQSEVGLSLKIIHVEIGTQRNMPIFVKHGTDPMYLHYIVLNIGLYILHKYVHVQKYVLSRMAIRVLLDFKRYLTAVLFETGAKSVPTKSRNPTICG